MPTRLPSFARAVTAVLVLFVLLGSAGCTPKPTVAELDRKVFATSLGTFDRWLASAPERLDSAAARRRPWDVSTDLCSSAPDTGPVFDFRVPCIRHDFAWRNLRRLQARLGGSIDTRARRLDASRQFLRDMEATCAARPPVQRNACRGIARAYFAAVSAVS